jgi:hypothetical protein
MDHFRIGKADVLFNCAAPVLLFLAWQRRGSVALSDTARGCAIAGNSTLGDASSGGGAGKSASSRTLGDASPASSAGKAASSSTLTGACS